jgi:two-component system sensor histidine kinase HydH
MAHELRNPLAALKGHAQLLEELLEGPALARASRVVQEAERLEKITEDLLAFARLATIERAEVSPLALAREAAALDPARVRVEDAGAPERFPLDALRARQLIDNLVQNALQIDESGKEVRVIVGRDRGGAALQITVEDQGPGLPEGELDRLFEPFFTTRTRGTGLGLAVARRCAELHGGTLRAERRAEGGARFVATFPEAP